MPDIAKCPHCGIDMRVPADLAGGEIECPGCAKSFWPDVPAVPDLEPRRSPQKPGADPVDDRPGRSRRLEQAEIRLRPAAIAVMVIGILRLIINTMITFAFGSQVFGGRANPGTLLLVMYFGIEFLRLSLTVYGAWQMLNARSFGWGLTATILTILPPMNCYELCIWPFYLGIGIWATVVICDADVKRLINNRRSEEQSISEDDG